MSSISVDGTPAGHRLRPAVGAAGWLCLLAPALIVALLAWQRRWVADDAFINFRIIDNFANGHGPVFNLGERVEAGTSTVWLYLLTLLEWLPTPLEVEWWSVILGIAATAGAVVLGQRAASRITRKETAPHFVLPLGAVVFIAIPPVWDFTTSGLEGGLTFLWISASFWSTVRVVDAERRTLALLTTTAVIISLGPLVRPDLALFWVGFGFVLLLTTGLRIKKHFVVSAAALVAIPAAYELFRMGYYAALGPNTALTKEATETRVGTGRSYLQDFAEPYHLLLPLVALAVAAVLARPSGWRRTIVWSMPLACGIAHGLYVVVIGGDYMHGRLLLPSLLGILLPVFALRATRTSVVTGLVVVPWAIVCALLLRPDYIDGFDENKFLGDERYYYVDLASSRAPEGSGTEHPVTLEDYRWVPWKQAGDDTRELAESGDRTFVHYRDLNNNIFTKAAPAATLEHDTVSVVAWIGMYSYAAGPDVRIADWHGLTDPVVSRAQLAGRGRPGHEKALPIEWWQGRYTDLSDPGTNAARNALSCGELRDVLHATSAPMTLDRFADNVTAAPRLWKFRYSGDPTAAEEQLC